MNAVSERATSLKIDGLQLEAMVHDGTAALAAVVLHPHPQYGGEMDNHVVMAICATLADLGATTLRFNTRGTGGSQGAYDGGRGEAADARAALAEVQRLRPDARVILAGYSFGAMIAASIAGDSAIDALVLVSPPARAVSVSSLPPELHVLAVTGDRDPVAPAAEVRTWERPGVRVVVVEGADHSWWPALDALVAEVRAFAELVQKQASSS